VTAKLLVTVIATDSEAVLVAESTTVTLTVAEVAPFTVPLSTPLDVFSVKPVGSVPALIDHV
jgi:hypothetical protein